MACYIPQCLCTTYPLLPVTNPHVPTLLMHAPLVACHKPPCPYTTHACTHCCLSHTPMSLHYLCTPKYTCCTYHFSYSLLLVLSTPTSAPFSDLHTLQLSGGVCGLYPDRCSAPPPLTSATRTHSSTHRSAGEEEDAGGSIDPL